MQTTPLRLRVLFVACAVLALVTRIEATAQPDAGDRGGPAADSAALEAAIVNAFPGLPLGQAARGWLMRQIRSGDLAGVGTTLDYFTRRLSGDIAPAERMLARLMRAELSLLADTAWLALALEAMDRYGPHAAYTDDLLDLERDVLRERAGGVNARFAAQEPSREQLIFCNLLINHVVVRGLRGREELNAHVADFAAKYPSSALRPIAERYIAKRYAEAPFGAAFFAGYGTGWFGGNLADRFRGCYGPVLGGELYVYRATVAGWFMLGGASVPSAFLAAGRSWSAGDADFTQVALDVGYEFRFGRLAVTPLAGLAMQSLRSADTSSADPATLPASGDRIGLDLSVLVGLRIPSDRGPHIDLRMRLGRSATALANYDAGFSGGLWYAQLGFALVQRPYDAR